MLTPSLDDLGPPPIFDGPDHDTPAVPPPPNFETDGTKRIRIRRYEESLGCLNHCSVAV